MSSYLNTAVNYVSHDGLHVGYAFIFQDGKLPSVVLVSADSREDVDKKFRAAVAKELKGYDTKRLLERWAELTQD